MSRPSTLAVVAAQELKPVYLITGNDRPKVEVALERLRARFDPGSIERLVAGGKDGASGPDVVTACNSGTLLSGDRLVLVTDVDGRPNEWGKLTGGWKQADVDAVIEYLAVPAPGTVLCLVALQLKDTSPLGKAVTKAGDVLTWAIDERRLAKWVGESFAARGVKIGGDASQALVDVVGDDKLILAQEIDKLATWAAGEPIGLDEVERLATPSAESHPWDLTDALGRRDAATALGIVEAAYARSPRTMTSEAAAFAARLAQHLTRLARMKAMLEAGVSADEAGAELGLKPFPARQLAKQAQAFSVEELRDGVVRFARLDHALKGGSKLAPDLELQLALSDVARERG